MSSLLDLPIELHNRIYDYAAEITPVTTTHPLENNQTRIQGYSSLVRVNKQVRDEIQSLHPLNCVLDITLFLDNLLALLSALKASRGCRILRDAKFRLASVVRSAARLDKTDEDVREFLLALDGFDDEWSPHPFYWRWMTLTTHNWREDDAGGWDRGRWSWRGSWRVSGRIRRR